MVRLGIQIWAVVWKWELRGDKIAQERVRNRQGRILGQNIGESLHLGHRKKGKGRGGGREGALWWKQENQESGVSQKSREEHVPRIGWLRWSRWWLLPVRAGSLNGKSRPGPDHGKSSRGERIYIVTWSCLYYSFSVWLWTMHLIFALICALVSSPEKWA